MSGNYPGTGEIIMPQCSTKAWTENMLTNHQGHDQSDMAGGVAQVRNTVTRLIPTEKIGISVSESEFGFPPIANFNGENDDRQWDSGAISLVISHSHGNPIPIEN